MRAILIGLVVVNAVWALWSVVSTDEPRARVSSDAKRFAGPGLALLSELPADALHLKTPATAPPAPAVETGPATEKQPAVETGPAAESAVAAVSVATRPDPEVDPEKAIASVGTEVSTDKPQTCLAMGPFDARDEAESLRDEVLEGGGSAEIVPEEIAGRPDFLVFIDTAGSRDVARRIREELQAREIDSHIIAGGDLQNALSVGVFSREPLALRQYDRVIRLGYETTVRELPRRHTVYHLMSDRPVSDPSIPSQAACHEIAAAHSL